MRSWSACGRSTTSWPARCLKQRTVSVWRVVSSSGHKLIVKFDRNAVIAILPVGAQVEVTVTGTARGIAFQGRDVIRQ